MPMRARCTEEEYRTQAGPSSTSTRRTRSSTRSGSGERNDDGIRLMPDGRPLEIIVETAGEDTEQTDVLELVGWTWKEAGIKLFSPSPCSARCSGTASRRGRP